MRTTVCAPAFFILVLFLSACGAVPPAVNGTIPPPTATATRPLPVASPEPTAMPCMLVHAAATPVALGADFEGRGHISGPVDAPVSIITFSTYQCSLCAFLEKSLQRVRRAHPNDVRLIFITLPQASMDKDSLAMGAAEAADLQGKYWEMHDLLFEKLTDWASLTPAAFQAWVVQQAPDVGLDAAKFQQDWNGSVIQDKVTKALQSAQGQATNLPTLFVNSISPYTGLVDFPSLDTVIRMEALESRQFSACPAWVIDPSRQYIATLQTAKGNVVIELYADKAPLAVNNFVFLARSHWYNGTSFYRVLPDQLVEAGDPSGTGLGNPGYFFTTEISPTLSFNAPGMMAMQNNGIDTNGSRFLITLAPSPQMNGLYTIIGHVISGMDVLKSLTPRDPLPGKVTPDGDPLVQVTIDEK